ncbi:PrsW family intramembrane metalloprotease [Clostridium sp. DJ247]|nr:PrsW family intramembrane metalloprotease [Clostridium sp. DJ247]
MKSGNNSVRMHYKWWRLLIIGAITYIMGIIVLMFTLNTNIFPSVVILGNFLIPVTYVAFFYERRKLSHVNMYSTAMSFFSGGFLGTLAAAVLEPIFIQNFSFETAIEIGIIEEFAKILAVLFILRKEQYRMQRDGIILGAAAGMGFAALESCGYAFTAFLNSGGSLSLTVYITLIRGILSPLGHGTWTAILAGVLLRERSPKRLHFNTKVIAAYVTVVLLHGFWDGLPSIVSIFTPSCIAVTLSEIAVGAVGIIILIGLWRESKRQVERLDIL